jgi:hypothetical protein
MGIFSWIRKVLSYDPSAYRPPLEKSQETDGHMNEGDFRSGPKGYSPNTSYPESFYGSASNKDVVQDEGYFNR